MNAPPPGRSKTARALSLTKRPGGTGADLSCVAGPAEHGAAIEMKCLAFTLVITAATPAFAADSGAAGSAAPTETSPPGGQPSALALKLAPDLGVPVRPARRGTPAPAAPSPPLALRSAERAIFLRADRIEAPGSHAIDAEGHVEL